MRDNVSVIMTTKNEDKNLLIRAIDSMLFQVRVNIELIVSTVEGDCNIELIKNKYPSVKLIIMPNGIKEKSPSGSFAQLNYALPHITGDWFTFFSSNDYAYSNKITSEIYRCQQRAKEVCYSSFDEIDTDDNIIGKILFHDYDHSKHLIGNFQDWYAGIVLE